MGEGEGREEERGGKAGGGEGRKGEEKRREERKRREGEEYNNSLCTLCVSMDGGERRWKALFLGSPLKKHSPSGILSFLPHTHKPHKHLHIHTHLCSQQQFRGSVP